MNDFVLEFRLTTSRELPKWKPVGGTASLVKFCEGGLTKSPWKTPANELFTPTAGAGWAACEQTTLVAGRTGKFIKDARREGIYPAFLLLTVSHTSGSPQPWGCCLTFKNHKSLVFLISITCRNSDFYQFAFKSPHIRGHYPLFSEQQEVAFMGTS